MHHGMKNGINGKDAKSQHNKRRDCSHTTGLRISWKAYYETITLYSKVTNYFLFSRSFVWCCYAMYGKLKFSTLLTFSNLMNSGFRWQPSDRQESILPLSKPGFRKPKRFAFTLLIINSWRLVTGKRAKEIDMKFDTSASKVHSEFIEEAKLHTPFLYGFLER